MMKYKLRYLLVALLLCGFANAYSSKSDSIRFSLLTCAPGSEIYAHFGHTAIRYENPTRGIDYVFNYGIFSFNTPNFILRFTLGETDYKLGVAPFDYFTEEYKFLQRDVRQQVLNLNQTEKEKLAVPGRICFIGDKGPLKGNRERREGVALLFLLSVLF